MFYVSLTDTPALADAEREGRECVLMLQCILCRSSCVCAVFDAGHVCLPSPRLSVASQSVVATFMYLFFGLVVTFVYLFVGVASVSLSFFCQSVVATTTLYGVPFFGLVVSFACVGNLCSCLRWGKRC